MDPKPSFIKDLISSEQNGSSSTPPNSSKSKHTSNSSKSQSSLSSSSSLLSSLAKASMGVESSRLIPDGIPDELLDKYVADLILKEAREKRGEVDHKGKGRER